MSSNLPTTATDVDSSPRVTPTDRRRAAWAGFVGTMLENFDMVVYSIGSAVIFNTLFFPNFDPAIGFIASFATYAVGFGARPLGGLFFSRYGDRLGRKFVMVATLSLMGTATFAIGLLPTYGQAGVLAPVLLVLCRFVQGFGAGAEMASGVVLLTEYARKGRRGAMVSLVWVGAAVGSVAGALVWLLVQLLPKAELEGYGWRLVFLSSIAVTIAAYVIRRRMKESPVFRELKAERLEASSPVRDVLKNGRKPLTRVFFINVGGHAHSYIYQVFIGAYLISTVHMPTTLVPQMLLLGGIVAIPAAYLAGRASDKWGRKPVNLAILSVLFLFSFPAFWLAGTGNVWLIGAVYVVGFAFAVEGAIAAQSAMFAELFGARYRYAGVALAREFSAIFGGGIAPMICSALLAWATGSYWPVAVYMMIVVTVSIIQSLRTPETADRDLTSVQDAD
ncbi:MFS transporter [Arthrobacter sp. 9V]|uniref:MFS transporter n=1 Tax=Arthrobacter sp. 9V TaxID=2653132 RepID=UPI0012F4613E|nr:MFS transporter [Arthrobacter sp. 9V]VXB65750.1 MFS transporter [Arthrobacter sp. 9V]